MDNRNKYEYLRHIFRKIDFDPDQKVTVSSLYSPNSNVSAKQKKIVTRLIDNGYLAEENNSEKCCLTAKGEEIRKSVINHSIPMVWEQAMPDIFKL